MCPDGNHPCRASIAVRVVRPAEGAARQREYASATSQPLMGLLGDALDYARYVTSVRRYVRRPLDFVDPRQAAERRLAQRPSSFLDVVERGVYACERSPYRPLLEHAGITIDDLRRLVADIGIDETLSRLYDKGVYVTFEEFKARRPIRRGSLELSVNVADFDNPLVGGHSRGQTGGSGGTPRPLILDVGMHHAALPSMALVIAAYNGDRAPKAVWFPPPPSMGGTSTAVIFAKLGNGLDKLFVTHPLDARARLVLFGTCCADRVRVARATPPRASSGRARRAALVWRVTLRDCSRLPEFP